MKEWEPIKEPYSYDTARRRKDQKRLKQHLRQFFAFSRLRRHILRKAAFKQGRSVRYLCASCKNLFKEASVEIDHINEVAVKTNVTDKEGLQFYADQLIKNFFRTSNLRVLCRQCHRRKEQYDL